MDTPTTRTTLANNLLALISTHAAAAGHPPSVRAWALARGLDVKLIDRLTKAENAVTLDKLGEIADACGLQPWMLLYDGFDPVEPPDAPITEDERAMLRKLRRLIGPDSAV